MERNDARRFKNSVIKRGEERGEENGKLKVIKLIQCMAVDGVSDLIPRIAEESDFCEEMFAKYDIE